jgi:hypothetical protein
LAIKADDALRLRLAGLYYHNKQYGEAASQSEQLLKKSWQKQAAIIRLSALTALQRYGVAADQAEELIRREPKERSGGSRLCRSISPPSVVIERLHCCKRHRPSTDG